MSPEYAMQGLFSDKSDVFSFGVLLLEIVSGAKNTNFYDDDESLTLLGLVSICLVHFINNYLFVVDMYIQPSFSAFVLTYMLVLAFSGMEIVE